MSEESNHDGFIKITGLWRKETKDGKNYLAGSLNNISQLAVMPNKFKKAEADPDYFLYLRASKKKAATVANDL